MTLRKGWLITVTDSGYQGYGDCAPFPSMGTESPTQAIALLQKLKGRSWADTDAVRFELESIRADFPAASHALETAVLDLQGKKEGIPVRKLLSETASSQIQVNAFSGAICQDDVLNAQREGFNVIKLKAGLQNLDHEIRCLQTLCATLLPQTRIRLDANGAWNMDEALLFLDAIADLPVESLEEPLHNPDMADLARLQSHTAITLALDESLQTMNLDEILSGTNIRRLVLKPGVLGGLKHSYAVAKAAAAAGVESVVTSLVDSAVGIYAACQLAAAVDALSPGMAHGLATSGWLARDIAKPPEIRAGYLSLPNTPGLGINEIIQAPLPGSLP